MGLIKYNPCTLCCDNPGPDPCNPSTTSIGINLLNSCSSIVDPTEISVTVTRNLGGFSGSYSFPPTGPITVPISKLGVYTVVASRSGQSITKTVNVVGCGGGSTSFSVMCVRITGCGGIQLGAGHTISISGQTTYSGTTGSTGQIWFLSNGAGTYNVSATVTRFVTLSESLIVTGSGSINTSYALTPASGYHCFKQVCFTTPIATTVYWCAYPIPDTLNATVGSVSLTLNYQVTTERWTGCTTITPLVEGFWFPGFEEDPVNNPCRVGFNACNGLCNGLPGIFAACQTYFPPGCITLAPDIPSMNPLEIRAVLELNCELNGFGFSTGRVSVGLFIGAFRCCTDDIPCNYGSGGPGGANSNPEYFTPDLNCLPFNVTLDYDTAALINIGNVTCWGLADGFVSE
jgi:hypothetical protein